MKKVQNKPTVRIIHHMARSGGTLICKCLATMKNVVLLSEIHPLGTHFFNPLKQAHEWFSLLKLDDINWLKDQGRVDFKDAITLISDRCVEQDQLLVLRDWSHLDFTAVPFVKIPSYRLTLADILNDKFEVIHTASVRHPIDQWFVDQKVVVVKR